MLIAFASCSKFEPLQEVQTTELNSDVDARMMPVGGSGEEGDEDSDITDPDHDEDHDKDKTSK